MADVPLQSALGSGIAQAFGEGAIATVNLTGFGPAEIAEMLKAAGSAQQTRIDELAKQIDVSGGALLGFFRILKEDAVPLEELPAKLELVAQRHNDLLARLSIFDPEDKEVRDLIDSARVMIQNAASAVEYDRADDLLFQAEEAQDRTISSAEALEQAAYETARKLRLRKANTRTERAELCLTRLDYLQAAKHFRSASETVGAEDSDVKFRYLSQSASSLESYGDEKGDNAVLLQAIDTYQEILTQQPRENVPMDWATTQHSLGVALWRLGERESGRARLDQALAAFDQALREQTRELVPVQWAKTQSSLGTALTTLAEREDSSERFQEAVAAYNNALSERKRERMPLQWAATQNNLGSALRMLGEKERSTERLREAVASFRAALEEYTRERVPLDWAMAQSNLGAALTSLGELEVGTDSLEEAVASYTAALEEYKQEGTPLVWAATKLNLGVALAMLGHREKNDARQEEAVTSYRAALEEYTLDRVPLNRAKAQHNLGNALKELGERGHGIQYLVEAVAAYREALLEYTPIVAPKKFATIQLNLGMTLTRLGQKCNGTAMTSRYEQAVEAIEFACQASRLYQSDEWIQELRGALTDYLELQQSILRAP